MSPNPYIPSTIAPMQVPLATVITEDAFTFLFRPGAPLQKIPHSQLLAKLISTDLVKVSKALLDADLAWIADKVALVHNDPAALLNGWYRKTGASGAGGWVQFETLATATRAAAEAAAALAAVSAAAAQGIGRYYATRAAGVAATALGEMFTSDEGGTLAIYSHIAGAPYYQFYSTVPTDAALALKTSIADLASGVPAKGSALVGHIAGGAGAVATSVQAALRRFNHVDDRGAVGNNVADDRAAFQFAFDQGGKISASLATYKLGYLPTATYNYALGPQPNVVLPMNMAEFDGGGATLNMYQGGRGLIYWPLNYPVAQLVSTLTADIAAGVFLYTVGSTAGWVAGDGSIVKAGEFPYDTPEATNWYIAKVVEVVSATVLKLDMPETEAFTVAAITNANSKTISRIPAAALKTLHLHDFHLSSASAPQAENGISINFRRGVTLERITGTYMGAGLIVLQYCENVTIRGCGQENVNVTQASYGRAFAFAECRGVMVADCWARGVTGGIKCEAGAEVQVSNFLFENTYPGDGVTTPAVNTVTVFGVTGRSKLWFDGVTVTGLGGFTLSNTSNGVAGYEGTAGGRNVTIRTSGQPYSLGAIGQIKGKLDLNIAGVRELYNLDQTKLWSRTNQ